MQLKTQSALTFRVQRFETNHGPWQCIVDEGDSIEIFLFGDELSLTVFIDQRLGVFSNDTINGSQSLAQRAVNDSMTARN